MPGSRVRLFSSLLERQRQRGLPSDEAIQGIADAVARAMGTEVATLYALDSRAGELVLAATHGLARSGVGFVTLKLGEGISGTAASRRSPLVCADISRDGSFKLIAGFDQSRYQSILAVPVLCGDELIGALNVQTTEVRVYGSADVQDLEAIARLLAPIVRHDWIEGDLALRLRGPMVLSSVDGILSASFGPMQFCEQVAAALQAILPNTSSLVGFREQKTLRIAQPAEAGSPLPEILAESIEKGAVIERDQDDLRIIALPLRTNAAVGGALAVACPVSAPAPWAAAHVRHYLDQLAGRVGQALDPMLARLLPPSGMDPDGGAIPASLYAELVELVLQDRGLEEVVETAAVACGVEIAVVDVFGTRLAGALPEKPGAEFPLAAGGQPIGRLVTSASVFQSPALETVAQVVSLELSKWKVRFEVEAQIRGGVLDLLLSGAAVDPPELQARASLVGLDLRRAYVPVVFAFDRSSRPELASPLATNSLMRAVQRHLGSAPDAVAFHCPEGLLALVSGAGSRLAVRATRVLEELKFIGRLESVGAGIGVDVERPSDYQVAIRRAALAATLGLRLGSERPVTSEHLGVHGLLLAISDGERLREYVETYIGSLLISDERNSGDLTRTLEAYHASGEHLSIAARLLSVHVNTLKYRLARIEVLTGRSLRDPMARFNMYTALYALRLTDPTRASVIPDEQRFAKLAVRANAYDGGDA